MHVHSIQICLEQKQKVKLCGNSANIDSLVQKKKKKITEHLLWNTENILEQAERRIKMSAKERGGGTEQRANNVVNWRNLTEAHVWRSTERAD